MTIGVLLAIVLSLASVRTFIRVKRFQRVLVDDAFLLIAVVCLVAGTSLLYVDIPYIYAEIDAEAGLLSPVPTNFLQQILYDQKIQDAATTLLVTTLFSVKLSFLFFFRHLIRRVRYMNIWWWCVFVILVPSAIFCMFSNIVSCADFGPSIIDRYTHPWIQQPVSV